MRRKIILLAAALMMFMGVVSASSINGDYKGNPIVNVLSNGVQLEVDEVPAHIIDGHTLVPISLLRQLGASVTWDTYSYTVDVVLPSSGTDNRVTLSELAKITESYRAAYFLSEMTTKTMITNSVIDDAIALNKTNEFLSDVNGLSYSELEKWILQLDNMGKPTSLINSYIDAINSLNAAKSYMIKLDGSNASIEIVKAAGFKNDFFKQIETSYDEFIKSNP